MGRSSKSKGYRGEKAFEAALRSVWPMATRLDRGHGDFINVPILIEAKSTETLQIPAWVRKLRPKLLPGDGGRWALLWKDDLRRADAVGPLAVLPLEFALELLAAWEAAPNTEEA